MRFANCARFGLLAGLLAACLFWGCKKSKPQTTDTAKGPPALAAWLKLDGKADDWAGKAPLIKEAGAPGRGRFDDIDIKEVYFANDENYLYVFLRCSPTVQERFAEERRTGGLCDLYFDTDNDLATGCKGEEGFKYGKISGYEIKVWIPLGVYVDLLSEGSAGYVSYRILRSDESGKFSFSGAVPGGSQSSNDEGSLIKDGPDGVELAIPLDKLGLKAGQTVRLLLAEDAHTFDQEGYTPAILKLR